MANARGALRDALDTCSLSQRPLSVEAIRKLRLVDDVPPNERSRFVADVRAASIAIAEAKQAGEYAQARRMVAETANEWDYLINDRPVSDDVDTDSLNPRELAARIADR